MNYGANSAELALKTELETPETSPFNVEVGDGRKFH